MYEYIAIKRIISEPSPSDLFADSISAITDIGITYPDERGFEAYETVGALFREATAGTLELSASDRIWELILDTILEIAEIISADACELLSAVIDDNPKFHKLYQMYKLVA